MKKRGHGENHGPKVEKPVKKFERCEMCGAQEEYTVGVTYRGKFYWACRNCWKEYKK